MGLNIMDGGTMGNNATMMPQDCQQTKFIETENRFYRSIIFNGIDKKVVGKICNLYIEENFPSVQEKGCFAIVCVCVCASKDLCFGFLCDIFEQQQSFLCFAQSFSNFRNVKIFPSTNCSLVY
jgi:hypothetical protein